MPIQKLQNISFNDAYKNVVVPCDIQLSLVIEYSCKIKCNFRNEEESCISNPNEFITCFIELFTNEVLDVFSNRTFCISISHTSLLSSWNESNFKEICKNCHCRKEVKRIGIKIFPICEMRCHAYRLKEMYFYSGKTVALGLNTETINFIV